MPIINGGTAEYANIVASQTQTATKIDEVREILEAQFRRSIPQNEIISVVDDVDDVFRTASQGIQPTSRVAVNPALMEKLAEQTAGLRSGLNNFKIAAPTIGEGGIGGLAAFGSKALVVLGRVCQVITVVQMIIDALRIGYTILSNIVTELTNRLTGVEATVTSVDGQHQRTRSRVNGLETGLLGTEILARQAFSNANLALNLGNTNSTRITELETQVANLEELIKSNHAATMFTFEKESELIKSNHTDTMGAFENTFTWQENNRSEKTATLSRAAVERENGMLFQTAEVLSKAVEGNPPESATDSDYQSAVNAGHAISAGTVGYAIFKNRQAITTAVNGVGTIVKEGIDTLKTQGAKLGKIINLGQVMQTVSVIISLHNALILSRDIGQTLFTVVDNGLNAVLNAFGIKNVNDEGVTTEKSIKEFLETIAKSFFGVQTWEQLKQKWAAANAIIASGSTLLQSINDLANTTGSLAAMAAENSGKIGNIMRRSGLTQDIGTWFPENYNTETVFARKMRESLESVQNIAQTFETITSSVVQSQQNIQEIKENNDKFMDTIEKEAPKFRLDNKPVKDASDKDKADSKGAEVTEEDKKPTSGDE
ncbi:hypothetical protein [Argonema galeatum]|uniref:hypothetical protein n=1 Tax=Argonema galeatum TaxID=2942762 RepID=UPI002013579B|nr:hypothetical protein [Argonema galeatum]MCL1466048.1 hypothetical protein [Argonema galeatum A003/A1]